MTEHTEPWGRSGRRSPEQELPRNVEFLLDFLPARADTYYMPTNHYQEASHMFRAVFSALVTATGPTDRTRAHNSRVQQARHNVEKGCAR